ncbi:SDR family oxidoreductase [Paenibacillus athensensis]|uniref:NAD(P)-dependent oxidoreductase n=1 Tax=Paenibacillus athensensis TaxID=1967502 RepID=A0A4Y8Q6X4_9BACL|nr:SDR family oxidoreductase [Paenibacillus athensensis]MCD1257436.1 SDR family oxidoreductase [Paenibacillus athensensis]
MKILVTGATGQLGDQVVKSLLALTPAQQIAVSVRDSHKAAHLAARGVEVREGDFDRPETLEQAFSGVDRLLLISSQGDNDTRIRQHAAAIEAAQQAKVGFIAYTSLAGVDDSPLFLAPVHRAAEAAIRASGIPYSFLRNNWYAENEATVVQAVLAGAPWITAAGAGRVGWAARCDYAQAAAAVLTGEGHEHTIYELSGPLRTNEQFAEELAQVIGKEVAVQNLDSNTYAALLTENGLPDGVAQMLAQMQTAIRQGALEVVSEHLPQLLGRPVTPLADVIRGWASGSTV